MQFMDTCFDFSNLRLPFLNEGLLISQFMRRKLSLQDLSLSLFLGSRLDFILPMQLIIRNECSVEDGHTKDLHRMVIILDRQLDALHNRSLFFRADLLSTLKCHKRHLEIMRRLLKRHLLMGLNDGDEMASARKKDMSLAKKKKKKTHTNDACIAESFLKSSEPLFAIARVDSVKSCLRKIILR